MVQTINRLNRESEMFLKEHHIHALQISKTDSVNVIFSGASKSKVMAFVERFGPHMISKKNDFQIEIDYKVGVGRSYDGLQEVGKSYVDAIRAIQHGPLVGEQVLTRFENLGIYKILCQPSLKEELFNFYESTLQPLVDYDEKKSTELVKTLEAYYQQSGNLRKTADVLFTHYNTTLYRMESIQKITGMQLANHKDRLNLEVALKIKKLLHK